MEPIAIEAAKMEVRLAGVGCTKAQVGVDQYQCEETSCDKCASVLTVVAPVDEGKQQPEDA